MDDSEHEARWSSAHNARTEGAFEEALRAYDEVTLLAERDHWPERQLEAHLYAADCARRLSQLDVSEQHLYAAVEIGRRRGLDGLLARALGELGTIAVHRGEVGVGSAWYREALELAQKAGEARAEATQLGNLGLLALQRGDHAQARTLLRQRLESVLALRAPHEAADTLTTLAEVELASGDPIAAEKALLRSLTLRRGKRTPRAVRGLACALILLARITREQGRLEEAQRLASRALRAAEAAKAQREASHARLQLGHLAQARGERTLAKHYLERAAEELHLLGEALQGLVADVALAGLAVDEGLLNEARKTYERIADGFEDHGNPKAAIDATLLAAQLDAKMGRISKAVESLEQALTDARRLEYTAAITRLEVNLAHAQWVADHPEVSVAGCLAGARSFESQARAGDQALALLGAGQVLVSLRRLDEADIIFQEAATLLEDLSDQRGLCAVEAWRCRIRVLMHGRSDDIATLSALCDALAESGDLLVALEHRLALATLEEADPALLDSLIETSASMGLWPIQTEAEAYRRARQGEATASLADEAEARGYRSLARRIREL